jgi:N-methylhydantoinase A
VVLVVDGGIRAAKVLTRPREPWRSVAEALDAVEARPESLDVLVNATTLATNMFFGQMGLERPRVVLITNRGFEDVVEIGRQNRPSLYDPFFRKPEPLVPRDRRYGVRGRIGADGREIESLDLKAVREAASRECSKSTVFAVAFLHSYANPVHEREAARAIREACPGAEVVLSSEVDPRPGEYERTSTTLVNAVLKPMLGEYIGRLERELRSRGFRGTLLVMKSDGGLATPEEALRTPAAFIESGPAAGVVATAALARALGVARAVSFDMGGTTAKAGSVVEGRPQYTEIYEVGGKVHMGRIVRGSGYPVRYPFIDLVEVSSGGGTIAWVDRGGALRVGPLSAGADPGPACYGRGGTQPTVTDANAVLGRLPGELAGGAVKVRFDLARRALERLAAKAGLSSPEEAADSVVALANTIMARAVRLVTVERGLDPSEMAMVAFGGAGPLHAVEVAAEVGMREVIVPPYPGVFSALGLLLSDFKKIVVAPLGKRLEDVSDEHLDRAFSELEREAVEALEAMGVERRRVIVARMLEMRYSGQLEAIEVPYRGLAGAREAFENLYEARFGFRSPEQPVEISALRVEAVGLTDKPSISAELGGAGEPVEERRVYVEGEWVEAPVYRIEDLSPGFAVEGPALVVYRDSTLYVPPGYRGRVGSLGEVRVRL